MRSVFRSLRETYLAVDPRSLGLFRISLGTVLLWDLFRRYEQLDFWYTNSGLLPNHTLLWRPPAGHVFSLFFVASSRAEATLGFAACALVYALFTLGYRTRLMQVLALIARVSLNSRLAVLENGGDMVINLLCLFSLGLPLDRRFSLDALRRALSDGRITSIEALNESEPPARERERVYALAMFGLLLQFAAIYFFNASSKHGDAWTHGLAVHYALHQDKFVTGLGVWMREHLPPAALRALTYSTLGTEWLGFALIVTPIYARFARGLAVVLLPLLHLSFALGLHLGAFSPAMMSFFPLLLTREHWNALGRWLERRSASRVVELGMLDVAALRRARVLRELDRFGRIEWHPVPGHGMRMDGSGPASPASEPRLLATLLPALPWGFLLAPALRLPGGQAILRLMAAGIRRWAQRIAAGEPPPRSPSAGRVLVWAREAAVLLLMLAIASEILNDNEGVPKSLHVEQPEWVKAVIEYPRILQGWRMFAPNPPQTDSMIYVEAITADGTRVDPYNAVASRQTFPAGDVVPVRMDQSQFFTMYSDRIANANYSAYRQAFQEWLIAYPERTGRANDCLTSFDVYLVEDESPSLGAHTAPKPLRRERFMQYVAPPSSECRTAQLRASAARP